MAGYWRPELPIGGGDFVSRRGRRARGGRRRAWAGFRKAAAERTTLMGWKADSGERQRLAWYNSLAPFRGRFGMPFETPDWVVDSAKEPVLERLIRLRGHAKCDAGGEKVECPL